MAGKQIIKALKISDIKISDIVVSSNKINKVVPITYLGKPLVCQTPFIEVMGKLRETTFPNIFQMDTLFKGDGKQKIHQWYQFIENLETQISDQVMNNGSKWFTQKNVTIKSLIREVEAEKGIFFIKWPIDLQTNIFIDEFKTPLNPANLKEKDLVKMIIEISNLWINENQCGLAVIVQKVMVKPYSEKQQSEYIFDDTDSEPNEKETNIISLLATEQKKTQTNSQNQNTVPKPNDQNGSKPKNIVNKKQNAVTVKNKTEPPKSSVVNPQVNDGNPKQQKKIETHEFNPVKHILQNKNKNFQPVISDESENEETSDDHKKMKRLIDEYSPSSSEMAEINEDDLEMDNT